MLGYTALAWIGSSTRTFIGISDALRRNSYVGGPHKGKNLAQDAAQVFGLVIGDQIGKLTSTAAKKLPCPVGA